MAAPEIVAALPSQLRRTVNYLFHAQAHRIDARTALLARNTLSQFK
jgi:hypothetical protein